MEQRKSIEQLLENLDNNIVRKTKKSPIPAIIFIIAGLVCLIVNTRLPEMANSIWPPLLLTLGAGLIIVGIIALFFRKNQYVSTENKKPVSFTEVYYDIQDRDKLVRIVNNKDFQQLKSVKKSTHDALKLRVAATPNGEVCFSQVVTYVPYEYVNATDAIQVENISEAKNLLEAIGRNK